MQPHTQVSHAWQDTDAAASYKAGVSLTVTPAFSLETFSFIHSMCTSLLLVGKAVEICVKRSKRLHGLTLDFESAHWRPPLVPLMAHEIEHRQIAAMSASTFAIYSPLVRSNPAWRAWVRPLRGHQPGSRREAKRDLTRLVAARVVHDDDLGRGVKRLRLNQGRFEAGCQKASSL